jgi:hypothetical protein
LPLPEVTITPHLLPRLEVFKGQLVRLLHSVARRCWLGLATVLTA